MREWADADEAAQMSMLDRRARQFEFEFEEDARRRRLVSQSNRSVTPPPWTRSRGAGASRFSSSRLSSSRAPPKPVSSPLPSLNRSDAMLQGFFRDLGVCIDYLG